MVRSKLAAAGVALIYIAAQLQFSQADAAGRSTSQLVNTILNGKGAPKNSIGSNGDFYIDTRSLLFYGPKSKGKWPTPKSIQGPTGPSGNDGKNGLDAKAISNSNVSTVTGARGEKGDPGAKGDQGLPGAAGPAGTPGAIGPAGPAGIAGAQGPAGSSGSNGSNGAAGAQGSAGAKGETGTTGPSEITVISIPTINLSTPTQYGYAEAIGIGNLQSFKSYSFSIQLKGTSSVDSHVLGIDILSPGNDITFSFTKNYFRYATYSNTATWYAVEILGTVYVTGANSSLSLRVIDGFGDTGTNPLTFTGKAYITLVGAIR